VISIYCDGSSSGGSKKPGGYGYVIVTTMTGMPPVEIAWGYGGSPATTNNLMEMEGAIQGLLKALEMGLHEWPQPIELVSDSQYTLGIASGGYNASTNLEEAARLRDLALKVKCRFRWVRGHQGEVFNEACDELAKLGKTENTPADVLEKRAARESRRAARRKAS
jgi:ribonuclease HI